MLDTLRTTAQRLTDQLRMLEPNQRLRVLIVAPLLLVLSLVVVFRNWPAGGGTSTGKPAAPPAALLTDDASRTDWESLQAMTPEQLAQLRQERSLQFNALVQRNASEAERDQAFRAMTRADEAFERARGGR